MTERRRFLRADYTAQVQWRNLATASCGVSVIPDITKDISAGGMRLVLKERIEVDTQLALAWLLPPLGRIEVRGQVRWVAEVERIGDSDKTVFYHAGIEFLGMNEEERDVLNEFVVRLGQG